MPSESAYKIYVYLPELDDTEYVDDIRAEAHIARNAGFNVCLIVDYHVQDPWHGPPPHLDIHADGSQSLTKDRGRRQKGLGLAPFGWKEGWLWARARIANLLRVVQPEYLQQAIDHNVRIGWGFADGIKEHWSYNDTMTIFNDAANDANWAGTFVVSSYKTSMYKARKLWSRTMWWKELGDNELGDGPPPPPPPSDTCESDLAQCLVLNDNCEEYVDLLKADIEELRQETSYLTSEVIRLQQALEECSEGACEECPDYLTEEKFDEYLRVFNDLVGKLFGWM